MKLLEVMKSVFDHRKITLSTTAIGLATLAILLAGPTTAQAAASCAHITDLKGKSCEELTYKIDISACPSKQTAYVTKSCAGSKALVRAQASDATYAFSLSQGSQAWGRQSWTVTDVKNLPAEAMPKMKSTAANQVKIDHVGTVIPQGRVETEDALANAHGNSISAEGAKLLGRGESPAVKLDATKSDVHVETHAGEATAHAGNSEVTTEKHPAQEANSNASPDAANEHKAKSDESLKDIFKGGGEPHAAKGEMESLSLAGVQINGYLDMYTQTNFASHSPVTGARYLGNRNGDLQINTAELDLKRKTGDVTFLVDIGAGENENAFSGYIYAPGTTPTIDANSEITKFLPQAYISYTPSEVPRLTINAGKIYTPFGFETPKAKENWLYTHSYSWMFAIPIWHEEVNASYEIIPEKLKGSIFLFNSWDGRLQEEPNRSPSWAAEIESHPTESTKLVYRGMAGAATGDRNIRQLHELVAQYILNPKWAFAFEGVYGTQTGTEVGRAIWWGTSIYAKYNLLEHFALAARFEHYDDSQGGFTIHGLVDEASEIDVNRPKINDITIGANWDLGSGLETRLEYRYDMAQDTFSGFTNSSNDPVKNQSTVNLALLYGF